MNDTDTAKLAGTPGTFAIEVVGYEFPESGDPYDKDLLVVRITWRGRSMQVDHSGPILLAGEIASWAHGLHGLVEVDGPDQATFEFTEPSVAMVSRRKDAIGHYEVTLRIFGEPATIGEKFEVAFDVDRTDISAFAAALGKLSRQFPVR